MIQVIMFCAVFHIRDNYRFVSSAVSHLIGGSWCHVRTEDTQSFLMGNLIHLGASSLSILLCPRKYFYSSVPQQLLMKKKTIFSGHEEVLEGLG